YVRRVTGSLSRSSTLSHATGCVARCAKTWASSVVLPYPAGATTSEMLAGGFGRRRVTRSGRGIVPSRRRGGDSFDSTSANGGWTGSRGPLRVISIAPLRGPTASAPVDHLDEPVSAA